MEGYLIIAAIIFIIFSIPYLRLLCKRLKVFILIKKNKKYTFEYSPFSFFSLERFSKGFTITNKETGKRITVHIIAAYNKRETIELTSTQFRIKKIMRLMGGRIGAGTSMSWHTNFAPLPAYITEEKKNTTFLLFNPVPLDIKYNYNDIFPNDIIFGSEIVTGTILLSKID